MLGKNTPSKNALTFTTLHNHLTEFNLLDISLSMSAMQKKHCQIFRQKLMRDSLDEAPAIVVPWLIWHKKVMIMTGIQLLNGWKTYKIICRSQLLTSVDFEEIDLRSKNLGDET